MTVLPVVAREMSVLARRRSMYWSRWVTVVLALLVMLWLLVVSASQVSFAELGRSIFLILSSLCFTFSVLVGMQATADCLSEEKREGTLGLLFLTDLKSFDVISGKLAASSLQAAMALIGVIPMISMALLLGGVTLRQFGEVSLVLANTMFVSLALGVFVSSLSRNERKAMVGTFVGLFLIVLGPWIIAYLFRQLGRFPDELLAASPLYNFAFIHSNAAAGGFPVLYFWHSLAGLHLFGWALLVASAWILPRFVNELPARRFLGIRQFADNFVYGRLEQRTKHRAELLDRNAFLWLASRERVKPRYAWVVLSFFIALYLWIALQFRDMLFDVAIGGAVMFLTHLVFKIWAASEVCSRLIEDRRSGALELLLSTPLSVEQIAQGQSLALRRIFLKPIAALILIECLLLYGGLNTGRQVSAGERVMVYGIVIGTFLIDLWALKWVGLWLSLTGKSMERVLLATLTRVLILPWVIYTAAAGFFGARIILMNAPVDSGSAVFMWGLVSVVVSVALGLRARGKFLAEFRELATRRFDAVVEPEAPKPVQRKPAEKRRRGSGIVEIFRRRPVVSSIVILLLTVIFGLLGRAEYWRYRLRRELAEISAAGFPVTAAQASRFHPAPLPEQDAFAQLQNAGPLAWRGGVVARQRRPATAAETNMVRLAEMQALVAANQAQLRTLWRFPRYPRAYINPFNNDLWQMANAHTLFAELGEADLIVTLNNPAPVPEERVEQTIRGMLAHARFLRAQPISLAQNFAGQSLAKLAAALEEVLKRDVLDDETLQSLLSEALAVDDPKVLSRTLALQRVFFTEARLVAGPVAFGVPVGALPAPVRSFTEMLNNLGSREKAKVAILENYKKALELAKSPYPRNADHALSRNAVPMANFMMILNPMLGQIYIPEVFWHDAAFTAQLHLIQGALAAERYQRKYGRAPANLAALVPEFLRSVPIDPYNGENLRTFSTSDALQIYSVGGDQQDDTARAGPKTRRTGSDIVFSFR